MKYIYESSVKFSLNLKQPTKLFLKNWSKFGSPKSWPKFENKLANTKKLSYCQQIDIRSTCLISKWNNKGLEKRSALHITAQ